MSFSKGLACFLEMDLCYKVLSISCCFLACHDSKNLIKRENVLSFFKKKPCIWIGKHMVQSDIALVPWKLIFSPPSIFE